MAEKAIENFPNTNTRISDVTKCGLVNIVWSIMVGKRQLYNSYWKDFQKQKVIYDLLAPILREYVISKMVEVLRLAKDQ